LRILHLINNLRREGAQVVLFNLVTSTAGRARHVVCARAPGGALQAELEARGVRVFAPDRYHGALGTRHSLRFVDQVLENEAIHLVHAHMADCAFLGGLAAARRRLPLVITHHGQDILPGCNGSIACRFGYAILLALAARYARRNIAVAPAVADVVCRRLVVGRKRVAVIANGVPIPPLHAKSRARVDARAPCIVSVGRLVELKGHEQLIAAAAPLAERYPNLRIFIVGGGPLRESLAGKAQALGVADRIVFTGVVDDVSAYLREADVYVSTSHREGMPLAVLEAMAWQVPVVASDAAGNRAVVRHEETGLLYHAGDVSGLVQAITTMIDGSAAAREYAGRARRLVEERYGADAAVRAYEHLYAEVFQGMAPRGMPIA
jgi:glycosyltransferase involved in cell wall biosynthesis